MRVLELEFLEIPLLLFLIPLFVVFFFYFAFFIISIFSKKSINKTDISPKISIIVPTYNEENSIRQKVENLMSLNYPQEKVDIIIIDSGSTDSTLKILSYLSKKYEIKLILEKHRKGKSAAINKVLPFINGEIVFISDANSLIHRNAILEMLKNFNDKKVGGVGPNYLITDLQKDKLFNPSKWEKHFMDFKNIFKQIESNIHSISFVQGELAAFRANALTPLPSDTISDDFELTLSVIKKGYRVVHESNAVVYEPSPISLKENIRRKIRHYIGSIQVIVRNKDMIFNPKYNAFGMFVLPFHAFRLFLQPYFILISFVFFFYQYDLLLKIFLSFQRIGLFILLLYILLETFLIILKRVSVTKAFIYFFLLQIITIVSHLLYHRKEKYVLWEKMLSHRR